MEAQNQARVPRLQEAEIRYAKDLTAARADTDELQDIAACGFLTLPCADLAGRRVVLVIPDNLPPHTSTADAERIYLHIIATLDSIADNPYTVIYVHSGAAEWKTRSSVLSLRSQYERCAQPALCASFAPKCSDQPVQRALSLMAYGAPHALPVGEFMLEKHINVLHLRLQAANRSVISTCRIQVAPCLTSPHMINRVYDPTADQPEQISTRWVRASINCGVLVQTANQVQKASLQLLCGAHRHGAARLHDVHLPVLQSRLLGQGLFHHAHRVLVGSRERGASSQEQCGISAPCMQLLFRACAMAQTE